MELGFGSILPSKKAAGESVEVFRSFRNEVANVAGFDGACDDIPAVIQVSVGRVRGVVLVAFLEHGGFVVAEAVEPHHAFGIFEDAVPRIAGVDDEVVVGSVGAIVVDGVGRGFDEGPSAVETAELDVAVVGGHPFLGATDGVGVVGVFESPVAGAVIVALWAGARVGVVVGRSDSG